MVEQARIFIQHQTGTFYHLFNPCPEQSVDGFVGDLSNSQVSVEGPEAIFGKLFDYVGYGEIGGLFRPLVLSRLVAPGSKLKTVDLLIGSLSRGCTGVHPYTDSRHFIRENNQQSRQVATLRIDANSDVLMD